MLVHAVVAAVAVDAVVVADNPVIVIHGRVVNSFMS